MRRPDAPACRTIARHAARAAALSAALAWPLAASALFDDDEARKAILDLRSRVSQNEIETKQKLRELGDSNAQLTDQLQQARRSLVDLNTQNEALRQEVARLRGQSEQAARDIADLQRRQKDIAQGVDERIRKFEPQTIQLDGKEFVVEPEEKTAYDDAMGTLRSGDFDKATLALEAFAKRYPKSGYNESVQFWLGNAQYGRRQYAQSITTFRNFIAIAPESPRAPEAMLALANSQIEMKDSRSARKTLGDLVKAYPSSEAAQAGRERLAALKP